MTDNAALLGERLSMLQAPRRRRGGAILLLPSGGFTKFSPPGIKQPAVTGELPGNVRALSELSAARGLRGLPGKMIHAHATPPDQTVHG